MIDSGSQEVIYRVTNLKQHYQDRCVLDLPMFEVFKGEILGLIGPSGSGKSTLLRLLNFLEYPTEGKIEFIGSTFENGKDIPIEKRRRVTTVFQRSLLLNRTVRENIAYGLQLHGRQVSQEFIDPVLVNVGLKQLANQSARTLSGGEAQRVALGRAIALNPDVLLLDEPTANLDPVNVVLIEKIIRELNHQHATTIILVTHQMYQAKRLAHRTGYMLGGRIIELAETQSLFGSPQDDRTLAFIKGEMVY